MRNSKSWFKLQREEAKYRDLDLREEAVEAARFKVVVNGVVRTGVAGGVTSPADTDHSTTTIGPAASHNSQKLDQQYDGEVHRRRFEEEEEGREQISGKRGGGTHLCVFPSGQRERSVFSLDSIHLLPPPLLSFFNYY